ncbi:calcium/sodium antiporter [Curvivirga aplysinae]|uniref:calcium/sodium antiporter n=1 Tax=Curvivirga aplysinae TaxID=2529852 RepID=UPI0012BC92C1|nr:calcium/sodium antiporter [Curvivirga aplysinae]MTI11105.1 calcium/sodium antiporter [Curvivirga aplysinae]
MDFIYIIAGLVLLFVGGEISLRGAIALAKKLGVSPAIIGLTVIGFGTSAPELLVTVKAALHGQPDLAIANVVGSNISNILLILGVGGLIYPLVCDPKALRRDGTAMVLAMALLTGLAMTGWIVFWQGVMMLCALVSFLVWSYYQDKKQDDAAELHEKETEEMQNVPENWLIIAAFIILGLIGLVGGANILVIGAVNIATSFGIPESVIGLTIVALGTSLPELAATAVAAMRRHTDVAIGNVVGSCLFNVLSILCITAMITPLEIADDIAHIDVWVMMAACLALGPLLLKDYKICRWDAGFLLVAYFVYIGSLAFRVPGLMG